MSNVIEEGRKAPAFTLTDQHGEKHALDDYAGRTVVLYFYPKDDTPGCTAEACDFRDRLDRLAESDAVVLGVSPDDTESHRAFAEKYDLPFPLLADERPKRDPEAPPKVAAKYGAWGEKKNYGKTYEGLIRTTYVIDPDRRVRKVFPNVRAKGHVDRVVKWLDENPPS